MRIGLILFNLLLLIFVLYLIYLFIYLNYRYEGFEDSSSMTTTADSTEKDLKVTTVEKNYLNNIAYFDSIPVNDISKHGFDGNSALLAYPSIMIPMIKRNFEKFKTILAQSKSSMLTRAFTDGYYYVKFNQLGGRYIYCIMNEAYYGGGWMLAMRGVRGSTTFKYDSSYWTDTRTLNDDYSNISSLLGEIYNKNNLTHDEIKQIDELKTVSSIGNKIYETFTDSSALRYDIKTDAYNNYNAREWMVIFYYKNGESISRGGDDILRNEGGKASDGLTSISSLDKNTRGWIWRESPKSTLPNQEPQSLQSFFSSRAPTSTNGLNTENNNIDFKSLYGVTNAKQLKKWSRKPATDTGSILWSAQDRDDGQAGYNFYGINYEIPNKPFKVRWGFVWNNESDPSNNSNDAAGGLGMHNFSCADIWNHDGVQYKGVNSSIAFELYVR